MTGSSYSSLFVLGAVDLCVEVAPELVEELVRDVRGGRVDDLGESEDEGEGEGEGEGESEGEGEGEGESPWSGGSCPLAMSSRTVSDGDANWSSAPSLEREKTWEVEELDNSSSAPSLERATAAPTGAARSFCAPHLR